MPSVRRLLLTCLVLVSVPSAAWADHWRYHDGRWNLWNDGDQRWYHTDGRDWYYNRDNRWNLYRFDGKFGHDGFRNLDQYRNGLDAHRSAVPGHNVPPDHYVSSHHDH